MTRAEYIAKGGAEEMAKLIEGTIYRASQLGIETLTPAEIARLYAQ